MTSFTSSSPQEEFIEETVLPDSRDTQTTSYGPASRRSNPIYSKGNRDISGRGRQIPIHEVDTESDSVAGHAVGPAHSNAVEPLEQVHAAQQALPQGRDEAEPYHEPSVSPSSSPQPKELFSSVHDSETSSASWTAINRTEFTTNITNTQSPNLWTMILILLLHLQRPIEGI